MVKQKKTQLYSVSSLQLKSKYTNAKYSTGNERRKFTEKFHKTADEVICGKKYNKCSNVSSYHVS